MCRSKGTILLHHGHGEQRSAAGLERDIHLPEHRHGFLLLRERVPPQASSKIVGRNSAESQGTSPPRSTAGLVHPYGRAHAPNENIRIDLYLKHAKHMARILNEFAG